MEFAKLHEKFKDKDSPSVEGQVRWLQKMGFAQHQIEQAMIATYTELDRGTLPKRWKKITKHPDGKEMIERKYQRAEHGCPGPNWKGRDIKDGFELDQFLLEEAKKVRTQELSLMIANMEKFEGSLKKKWKAEVMGKVPWYKRMFGVKSALKEQEEGQ